MAKRKPVVFESAVAAGVQQSTQAEKIQTRRGDRELMPLNRIQSRSSDTRPLNAEHLVTLAQSICALGLLEPVVVDTRGRLIAGAHRLAACRLLSLTSGAARRRFLLEILKAPEAVLSGDAPPTPAQLKLLERIEPHDWLGDEAVDVERFARVPVHKLDLDAEKDPSQALAAEIAENEKRRDYTRSEVHELATRLQNAGFRDVPGRPRRGQRALTPALETILGRSTRTIRRLLADEDKKVPNGTIKCDVLFDAVRRSTSKYMKTIKNPPKNAADREIHESIKTLHALLEARRA